MSSIGQRLVHPRQDVQVQRVDLAELHLEFAGLGLRLPGQVQERDVALLDLDAVVAEGEEEVGAGVGIHDGLERDLGFLDLEGRSRSGRDCGRPTPGSCR